jgi:hypothetical protein
MCSCANTNIEENTLELSDTEEGDNDNVQTATTSLPGYDQSAPRRHVKVPLDPRFRYPVELPIFSPQVMSALETHNIESEWQTLIDELVQWIYSIKQTPLMKRDYQAIGQTVFKKYPCIAKDGFRPWSYLCKCITQKVRKNKKRRAALCVQA